MKNLSILLVTMSVAGCAADPEVMRALGQGMQDVGQQGMSGRAVYVAPPARYEPTPVRPELRDPIVSPRDVERRERPRQY